MSPCPTDHGLWVVKSVITALIDPMFWRTVPLFLFSQEIVCFSSLWSVATATYSIYLYKGWQLLKLALKRPLRPPPPMPPRKWSSSNSSEVGDPNLTEGRNPNCAVSLGLFLYLSRVWGEKEGVRLGNVQSGMIMINIFRPVALFMNYICINT